jgi:putative membrane protein insertion efficiency factor
MSCATGEASQPRADATVLSRAARWAVVMLVRIYQVTLSPWLGPACRFDPSCSSYAVEAIERHGVTRGGWLALRRIGRCHPMGGFGYDPVP